VVKLGDIRDGRHSDHAARPDSVFLRILLTSELHGSGCPCCI